jgi:hypothetical protein
MMDKADWIVLRLVRRYLRHAPTAAVADKDVMNTMVYLHKKYGKQCLNECIDQLTLEHGK